MANQILGNALAAQKSASAGAIAGAVQGASMQAATDYAQAKEEIRRYSLGIRPRALVYEVDGGYLVQMVPDHEGEFFKPPKICMSAEAVGIYLLNQQAIRALET